MTHHPDHPPSLETLCAHAGSSRDEAFGSVTTPIYMTSTFTLDETGREREFHYTRMGNPTRAALERTLAALEGGAGCVATAAGVAAETTVMHLFGSGTHVVSGNDIYGGTFRLFTKLFEKQGFTFSFVDMSDSTNVERALRDDTRAIWIETPSNPLLRIVDIEAMCDVARGRGVTVIVDNTFATPCFQQPLRLGADIVVHSTSKYLNGHSDIIGGAVIAKTLETAKRVAEIASWLGTTCSPFDAWAVLRGLRTLHVRMEAHQRNAMAMARFLLSRSEVMRVYYPGLPDHPKHDLAARQMSGSGGMVSFDLRGGKEAVFALFRNLRLFASAASLGGIESLIEHPATLSHASMTPEARAAAGITDGCVRISLGIESPDDLIEDMKRGLEALRG
ncbi:MAG TPA: PLP-dependent aspartate aminotransferase family protein [Planctomycetota bacterium]|nr:PLP-dependent aspartate aminotransferase family protein [Planctomycetota bacterium]